MALTDTYTNTWRESQDVELELESFHGALNQARTSHWRESDVIGDQFERFLSAITRQRTTTWRELSFLGSPESQLPETKRNNWREPVELLEGAAL